MWWFEKRSHLAIRASNARSCRTRATARCLPAHSTYCMRYYPSDLKTSKSPDGGTPSARRRRRMNNKENIS
jgi:hypothetical protein